MHYQLDCIVEASKTSNVDCPWSVVASIEEQRLQRRRTAMVTLYRIKVEKEQVMHFDDRKKRLPVTIPANELPAEEPV